MDIHTIEGRGYYTEFLVTVARDVAGRWLVACPAIEGCALRAETDEEADARIKTAIKSLLEIRAGKKLVLNVEILKLFIVGDRGKGEVTWTGERKRIEKLMRTGVEPGTTVPPQPPKGALG